MRRAHPFVPNVSGEWVGISIRDTGIGVKAETWSGSLPLRAGDNSAAAGFRERDWDILDPAVCGVAWREDLGGERGRGKGKPLSFAIPCQPPVHPEDGQSPKEE